MAGLVSNVDLALFFSFLLWLSLFFLALFWSEGRRRVDPPEGIRLFFFSENFLSERNVIHYLSLLK